jgi:hypothetical protein
MIKITCIEELKALPDGAPLFVVEPDNFTMLWGWFDKEGTDESGEELSVIPESKAHHGQGDIEYLSAVYYPLEFIFQQEGSCSPEAGTHVYHLDNSAETRGMEEPLPEPTEQDKKNAREVLRLATSDDDTEDVDLAFLAEAAAEVLNGWPKWVGYLNKELEERRTGKKEENGDEG